MNRLLYALSPDIGGYRVIYITIHKKICNILAVRAIVVDEILSKKGDEHYSLKNTIIWKEDKV